MRLLYLLAGLCLSMSLMGQRGRRAELRAAESLNASVEVMNAQRLNSKTSEFAPAYYGRGLVFVSARHMAGPKDPATKLPFYDLYYSAFDANGNPLRPVNFSLNLNSDTHEGPVAFDNNTNKIYFTRSNIDHTTGKAEDGGRVRLKIYEATFGGLDWEDIRELPFNGDDYSTLHPALSSDGRLLFFASDREGGNGGFDIYLSIRDGNGWSEPYNLGNKVNSSDDELFPFYHDSGTLFFASNRKNGYGGADIFMMERNEENGWKDPVNIGKPFNSADNDFGLILNPEGNAGFFTSNRPGGKGDDDIYAFFAPDGIQGITFPDLLTTTFEVYNINSRAPISNAAIQIYELATGADGQEELLPLQWQLEAPDTEDDEPAVAQGSGSALSAPNELTNREGKAYILLDVNKSYRISISRRGYRTIEQDYRPRENTYNRPVEIPMDRNDCMTVDGFVTYNNGNRPAGGATILITNRQTNRMKTLSSDMSGKFTDCLENGYDYHILAEQVGYLPYETEISTKNNRSSYSKGVILKLAAAPEGQDGDQARSSTPATTGNEQPLFPLPIRPGQEAVLSGLAFSYGSAIIDLESTAALEQLARLMLQYPKMEVDITVHTDCQGTRDYNLRLSQERGLAIQAYLAGKGVAEGRVKTIGKGESQRLIDCPCESCSAEEQRQNRRVEVFITRAN